MSRFVAIDRDTSYLLPPSVNEWLPQDHLARFVVEVVDQMYLAELARHYAGCGSAAYPPSRMLGPLIYGYATGVHSSRKIERACHDSMVCLLGATDFLANTIVCLPAHGRCPALGAGYGQTICSLILHSRSHDARN